MGKRVAIIMEGSRGDIQPYMVAALALKEAGYTVLVLGPSDVQETASQFGIDFYNHYPINTKAVTTSAAMVEATTENSFAKLSASMNGTKDAVREEFVKRLISGLQDFKPDLILGCYLVLCDSLTMGLILNVPVLFLGLQVMVASNYLGAFGMFPQLPAFLDFNWRLWSMLCERFAKEVNQSSSPIIQKLLNMEEERFTPTMEEFFDICSARARYPVLLAASPTLHAPFPQDFNSNVHVMGPLMLDSKEQNGPDFGGAQLESMDAFLAAGEAPVYMGYGSMTCHSGKFMTLLSLRALMATGERGVILSGWANLSANFDGEPDSEELEAYCKEKVLFMSTAPHAYLFPRCKVIVNHGGAGTMNASALSGVPTVVVPIFLDQFYHADLANEKGFGVGCQAMKTLRPEELAAAIRKCIDTPEIRQKAKEVGEEMAKENGAGSFVKLIDNFWADYVDTGRFVKERETLREELRTSTWSYKLRSFLGTYCACFAGSSRTASFK